MPDLFPVCCGDLWGYVDRNGAMIINPKFKAAEPFVDGLALVNLRGTPDRDGGIIGGQWGYIDPDGKYAIPPQFHQAHHFSDGLAAVNIGAKLEYNFHDEEHYMFGGLWGFVDRSGAYVIPPTLEAVHDFHDGLAVARQGTYYFGFINRDAEWVIPAQYRYCVPFSEGLAAVSLKDKYGFVDPAGEFKIKPKYRQAHPFDRGVAAVLKGRSYSWSYIDQNGKEVFSAPEGVTHISDFHQDLAAGSVNEKVRMSDGKYYASALSANTGFFDRKGQWVIPPQFESAGNFVEDRAWVELDEDHYGYIKLDGTHLTLPPLTSAHDFRDGLAAVRLDGKFQLIGKEGSIVWAE
ncbi:MAG: WG repeat-containing protein [Acidobacteria bacterium]|nr:WG repeat-containing protein [Acidobacteriota bacterium]